MKKYRDHYFKKAKLENYPARSIYKLEEIDKGLKLLAPGMTVLDLGAAPGSWTLYAAAKTGETGRVLAVDLSPPGSIFPRNVTFVQDDVFSPTAELTALFQEMRPFDLILSDMAPKTTGIRLVDQTRSLELCQRALEIAQAHLRRGGALLVKIFQGPDSKAFLDSLKPLFASVRPVKPQSSRSESKEIFFAATGSRFEPCRTGRDGQ